MVTGSHIPADRNGLKFYVPSGEISKVDEQVITGARWGRGPDNAPGALSEESGALEGLGWGCQHSSVACDVMV